MYKIAVASSDGINIDRTFGATEYFTIYEVSENNCRELEKREYISDTKAVSENCGSGCSKGCGSGTGCGGGADKKVELISDCRCVVCTKIGFNIQKQLERRAISAFDVGCTVAEALEKITDYYAKIDSHTSLRK